MTIFSPNPVAFPQGRQVIDEALDLARRAGEGLYEAERRLLHGELWLLERGAELRAALSLVRIRQSAEPRSELAPDLRDAQTLFDNQD